MHTTISASSRSGRATARRPAATGREAVRLAPGHTKAHENLGNLELREGHWAAAVAQLQSAAQVDPSSAEVRARLGVALLKSGDVAQARSELLRALAMDPEQAIARRNLTALEPRAAAPTP